MGFWDLFKKKKDDETSTPVETETSSATTKVAPEKDAISVSEETEKIETTEETLNSQETVETEEQQYQVEAEDNIIKPQENLTVEEAATKPQEILIEEEKTAELQETQAETEETKEEPKKKLGFFARLKAGLAKTRDNIVSSFDSLFSSTDKIDDDFYEELEEILVSGDCGIHATEEILDELKARVKKEHIKKPAECKQLLIDSMKAKMELGEITYPYEHEPAIIFVIGVNGVGKTTSIGKLASQLKAQGKKVTLAGADTFRAAAGDQLKMWADRVGVEMIGGKEGADPASVLYDAVAAAKARKSDVLIVDTAGRLHNKKNLMEELKKMNRVLDREYAGIIRENFIVLDGTTGQNALVQAREFKEAAELTGIILTKMDGTAKGGIAIAVTAELGIPVKYIGVGEKVDDLQKFDSDAFIDALFDVDLKSEKTEAE